MVICWRCGQVNSVKDALCRNCSVDLKAPQGEPGLPPQGGLAAADAAGGSVPAADGEAPADDAVFDAAAPPATEPGTPSQADIEAARPSDEVRERLPEWRWEWITATPPDAPAETVVEPAETVAEPATETTSPSGTAGETAAEPSAAQLPADMPPDDQPEPSPYAPGSPRSVGPAAARRAGMVAGASEPATQTSPGPFATAPPLEYEDHGPGDTRPLPVAAGRPRARSRSNRTSLLPLVAAVALFAAGAGLLYAVLQLPGAVDAGPGAIPTRSLSADTSPTPAAPLTPEITSPSPTVAQTDTPEPTDIPTPEPTASPEPSESPAPSTGELAIRPTFRGDLDTGEETTDPAADIWYQQAPEGEYINPGPDSSIALVGNAEPGYDGCLEADLRSERLVLDVIDKGEYLCVRTREGTLVQLEVLKRRPIFTVEYTQWAD